MQQNLLYQAQQGLPNWPTNYKFANSSYKETSGGKINNGQEKVVVWQNCHEDAPLIWKNTDPWTRAPSSFVSNHFSVAGAHEDAANEKITEAVIYEDDDITAANTDLVDSGGRELSIANILMC